MSTPETIDTTEIAARLRRSITRLNRRLRQNALGGISPSQASMLGAIGRLGEPSLGDLAVDEMIQPPSVTRIVRTLEELGLIQMRVDPDDRRCTRVSLSAAGRREISEIRQRKNDLLERQLRVLSVDDQIQAMALAALLEQLQDGL